MIGLVLGAWVFVAASVVFWMYRVKRKARAERVIVSLARYIAEIDGATFCVTVYDRDLPAEERDRMQTLIALHDGWNRADRRVTRRPPSRVSA